jgi:hypothetical protein
MRLTVLTTQSNSLDLKKSHGFLAQVMLYTMRWVVLRPSHANFKLGQLKEEIPWGVILSQRAKPLFQSS